VYHECSFYLKVPRTKKCASKPNFRGNKYERVNNETSFSEKRQPRSDQSGESSCVIHNLGAANENMHGTSANTEIKVGENNFCKSGSNFSHVGTL
jgi:hypothetical protein